MDDDLHPLPSLHCVRCGYELRGLSHDANCPECGAPVEQSRHDLLRHADPSWLAALHRGMSITFIGRRAFFVVIVTYLMTIVAGLALLPVMRDTALEALMNALLYSHLGLFIGAFIAIGVGIWFISAPEPRDEERDPWQLPYHMLSGLLVPVLGLWFYAAGTQALAGVHWTIQQIAVHACFAVLVGQGLLMIRHTRRLDRRLPDPLNMSPPPRSGVPGFLLTAGVWGVLYWALPTLFWLLPDGRPPGPWQPPGKDAQTLLFFVCVLTWLAALSDMLGLRPLVAKERRAAA